MNINYRNLLPEESKLYRSIRLESLFEFPESFCADYHEALKIEKFRIESDIEQQSFERFVLGAFSEDNLIGICVFVKSENNIGHIYQMYVKKEFQGKNIGSGLIHSIINEANKRFNDIEIFLEVTLQNNKAYHLYKKIGFEEIVNETDPENSIAMKYIG
ncbi:Acetyltransferase (GNAT) domain-containing protein [Chryseobacterium ureilyticum]|uniref:Acetyltransferase (GNAT) domain-containing protein n=1 Tax=Chryseobacterium ureilyticum TaxID=373668 RepID=A0A1N7NZA8_9FLAO|nr:GNAT family N-acetyltransferase [Chryseobacterium ureilyticum]SIT03618.1 Acetyltransferase (GNAT) domain-containing protein [Chryseobacterium ureilyticum]